MMQRKINLDLQRKISKAKGLQELSQRLTQRQELQDTPKLDPQYQKEYSKLSKSVNAQNIEIYRKQCHIQSPQQVKKIAFNSDKKNDTVNASIQIINLKKLEVSRSQERYPKLRKNLQNRADTLILNSDSKKEFDESSIPKSLDKANQQNKLISTASTFYNFGIKPNHHKSILIGGSSEDKLRQSTNLYSSSHTFKSKDAHTSFNGGISSSNNKLSAFNNQSRNLHSSNHKINPRMQSQVIYRYQDDEDVDPSPLKRSIQYTIMNESSKDEKSFAEHFETQFKTSSSQGAFRKHRGLLQLRQKNQGVRQSFNIQNTITYYDKKSETDQSEPNLTNQGSKILIQNNSIHSQASIKDFVIKKQSQVRTSTLAWDKNSQTLQYQAVQPNQWIPKEKLLDTLSFIRKNNPEEQLSLRNLQQAQPKFEEISLGDLRDYDKKVFQTFEEECKQEKDVNQFIKFSGECAKGIKEGTGSELTPSNDFYFGQWSKGARNGNGICFYSDGQIYKGHWVDNCKSGVGMLKTSNGDIILANFAGDKVKNDAWAQIKYKNNDVFVGQLINEKKNGKGLYYYANGDLFEGSWENNKKEGKGQLTFKKGMVCVGKFAKDQFVSGSYTDEKGSVFQNLDYVEDSSYDGRFSNGKLFGYGRITYKNGDFYQGMFREGNRSGIGNMIYQNVTQYGLEQSEYKGSWKLNLRHGYGVMIWLDGSQYEGEWSLDKRVNGKMAMNDYSVYEGPFKNDVYHGRGSITFNDGRQFKGIFENGKVYKFGQIFYKDGGCYVGQMKDFRKEGIGCQVQNGIRYEGAFEGDQATGFGQILYSDGTYYIGEVKNLKKEGKGRMHYKNEKMYYQGNFYSDHKEGEGYLVYENGQVYCGNFKQDKQDGLGEVVDYKDMRQVIEKEIDISKLTEIQVTIHNGCRKLGIDPILFGH